MVFLALAADQPSRQQRRPIRTDSERLQALENMVAQLSKSLAIAEERLTSEEAGVLCDTKEVTNVSPRRSKLVFMVACDKLEPYRGGFKLTIAIGNPYAMTFIGPAGTLSYGYEVGPGRAGWTQKVPLPSIRLLPPGVWTRAEIVIDKAESKDMRYLALTDFTMTSGRLQ